MEFELVTTKGGDRGETSLYDGSRLRKDDLVFEALGGLDELNCLLGPIRMWIDNRINNDCIFDDSLDYDFIRTIQENIMAISSLIATPKKSEYFSSLRKIGDSDIELIEKHQKFMMDYTHIGNEFIVPGDTTKIACDVDFTRAVSRRCERRVVSIIRNNYIEELTYAQKYLNRLSDYLFVLARHLD